MSIFIFAHNVDCNATVKLRWPPTGQMESGLTWRLLDVRLRLPADLTKVEAARLAAFIQTLPFEGEQAATA